MKNNRKELLDFSYHENDYLNDYIKVADTKASILITLNGVILGLIINELLPVMNNFEVLNCLLILGATSLLLSYWYTLRLVFPNFKSSSGSGIIFWEDISKISKEEYQEKVKDISCILIELNEQNYYLAETATRKYRLLKSAFCFSIIGYSLILAFFTINSF